MYPVNVFSLFAFYLVYFYICCCVGVVVDLLLFICCSLENRLHFFFLLSSLQVAVPNIPCSFFFASCGYENWCCFSICILFHIFCAYSTGTPGHTSIRSRYIWCCAMRVFSISHLNGYLSSILVYAKKHYVHRAAPMSQAMTHADFVNNKSHNGSR